MTPDLCIGPVLVSSPVFCWRVTAAAWAVFASAARISLSEVPSSISPYKLCILCNKSDNISDVSKVQIYYDAFVCII